MSVFWFPNATAIVAYGSFAIAFAASYLFLLQTRHALAIGITTIAGVGAAGSSASAVASLVNPLIARLRPLVPRPPARHDRARGEGHRTRLIGREKGYHGVGFGGISVGGLPNNRKWFGSLLPGVDHIRHTLDLERNAFSRGLPAHGAELAG